MDYHHPMPKRKRALDFRLRSLMIGQRSIDYDIIVIVRLRPFAEPCQHRAFACTGAATHKKNAPSLRGRAFEDLPSTAREYRVLDRLDAQ